MSLIRRAARRPTRGERALVWLLAAANAALLALALARADVEVRDDSIPVTTGWTVSGGIALTMLGAALLALAPLPPRVRAHAQAYALGAQVLHASGHLFGFYYSFPSYDDVLHAGLAFALGLLVVDLLAHRGVPGARDLGPLGIAVAVFVGVVAGAGLWEMFEFTMDAAMGTREQDDLVDTMVDMLDGAVGGLAAAGAGAWAARTRRQAKALADARSEELLD